MRHEGAFGNVHDDRVFNAGDKIAHLLKVDSAIFSPPSYLLRARYPKRHGEGRQNRRFRERPNARPSSIRA